MSERYRIALLGRKITDSHRKEAFSAVHAGGLDVTGCGKKGAAEGTGLEMLEFTAEGIYPRREAMQMQLLSIASHGEVSIAVRPLSEFREIPAECSEKYSLPPQYLRKYLQKSPQKISERFSERFPEVPAVSFFPPLTGSPLSCGEKKGSAYGGNENKNESPDRNRSRRDPYFRLICFDMDSTLIRAELMDELGQYLGIGEQMRRITAKTMRGEICFRESFTERVALLKGLETEVLEKIVKSIPAAPGLEDAMGALRDAGIRTAIVTGGFTVFGRYLQKKYGFDDIFTTDIESSEGRLTGKFAGPILDGEGKARALEELCLREKISPLRCAAAGDGANDVAMLCRAGLSLAYHAGGLELPDVLHSAGVFEPYCDYQPPFR